MAGTGPGWRASWRQVADGGTAAGGLTGRLTLARGPLSLKTPPLPQATLLLNNIHKAPKAVLPLLKGAVNSMSMVSVEDLGVCDTCPSRETCETGFRDW